MNKDAMRSAQEEISEYRRQLQARTTELETLKSTKDSLERQRSELEDRHQADIASYQVGGVGQTTSPGWVTLDKSLSLSEWRAWALESDMPGVSVWLCSCVTLRKVSASLSDSEFSQCNKKKSLLCKTMKIKERDELQMR